MELTQPLLAGVIVKVTISIVNPLLKIVRMISPLPDKGKPVKFPEEGDAVQPKVEPGIEEERWILVV